jgi:hypothetical protein
MRFRQQKRHAENRSRRFLNSQAMAFWLAYLILLALGAALIFWAII